MRDTYTQVEQVVQAGEYIILPKYEAALPIGKHTGESLLKFLVERGDLESSQEVADYPVVNGHLLRLHYGGFRILPIYKLVTHSKPKECFSGWERGILERKKKVAAENAAAANRAERERKAAALTATVEF